MRRRLVICHGLMLVILLQLISGTGYHPLPTVRATSSPTLSNATVQNQQTSLTLPSGQPLYLYGLATGGGYPASTFANGEYASVTDVDGYLVAAVAVTTSDTNSYTTSTSYHNIGGASVSGYLAYTDSYGSNGAAGAASASDTFTVATAGSLVVVLALAGGEQCQTLSGIPSLSIDATNNEQAGLPVVITVAHAYPSTGTYTITEQTTQCAAGQDPNHAGDIVGIFIFTPSTPTPTAPSAPQNLQASAGAGQVALSWDTPATDGGSTITGYRVYRGTTSGGETLLTSLGVQLSHTDSSVTSGVTYYYEVTALNSVGESTYSNEVRATPFTPQSATIGYATVKEQQTSLQLPSGGQLYVYGYATGGAYTSSPFQFGQYASIYDASGYLSASLAVTNSYTNGFTTSTFYQVLGGFSASGFSSYTPSYGSNNDPGATTTSDTFTVSAASSLVTLLGTGASAQCLTLGGIPGLQIDAASPNDHSSLGMAIGHAYLSSGTYTATVQTTQCAAGQDPNHVAVLIGVFVFAPSTPAPTVPSAPQSLQAIAGTAKVTLSWSAPASNGGSAITSYNVYRGTTSNGETFLSSSGSQLSYTDNAVTGSTLYYYKVTAVNGVGEGNPSNEASATPSSSSPPVDHIMIFPNPASVFIGEHIKFSATAYDASGNVISGVPITWSTTIMTDSIDPNSGLYNQNGCPNGGDFHCPSVFLKGVSVSGGGATGYADVDVIDNSGSSPNWTGYVAKDTAHSFTAVQGDWIEPTISSEGVSGTWIGLGGVNNSPLLQIGVAESCSVSPYTSHAIVPNHPSVSCSYGGFAEKVPGLIYFPLFEPAIQAGDGMTASIVQTSPGTWKLSLNDITRWSAPWSLTITPIIGSPDTTTAEWIHEVGIPYNLGPFADFSLISFTNAYVTTGGVSSRIGGAGGVGDVSLDAWMISGFPTTTVSHLYNYDEFNICEGTNTCEVTGSGTLLPGAVFSLGSPADLTVADQNSHTLQFNSTDGTVASNLPRAYFFLNGTKQNVVIFQPNGTYTIILRGTGDGEYHFIELAWNNQTLVSQAGMNATIHTGDILQTAIRITSSGNSTSVGPISPFQKVAATPSLDAVGLVFASTLLVVACLFLRAGKKGRLQSKYSGTSVRVNFD